MISNPVGILRYKILSERGRAVAAVWNIPCGTVAAHEPPNAPQTQSQVLSYLLTFYPKSPAGISFYFPMYFYPLASFQPYLLYPFVQTGLFPRHQVLTLHLFQDFKSSHPGWSKKCWKLKLSRWDAFNLSPSAPSRRPGHLEAWWKALMRML